LVGAGTARADDPLLTPRDLCEKPPRITRVVLDPCLTISPKSRLALSAAEGPVVIFAGLDALDARQQDLETLGVEVLGTPRWKEGLDLDYVLNVLARRGIRGILVEGGGETATSFVRRGLADKLTLFYAPKLIGSEGMPMIRSLRATKMAESLKFSVSEVERFGGDFAVTLYPAHSAKVGAKKEERVHRAG
ncbi:MAG TPA: RibD family protein, partial [Rubrobacter sp.]|nr:RibD family protein [Rubrobacter sp.]